MKNLPVFCRGNELKIAWGAKGVLDRLHARGEAVLWFETAGPMSNGRTGTNKGLIPYCNELKRQDRCLWPCLQRNQELRRQIDRQIDQFM